MRVASTFVGKSGAGYTFADIQHERLQPRTAGTFLYVRQFAGERAVLFVGDCNDLSTEASVRWSEAVREHGATHIYVRRNVSSRVRQEEHDDLLGRYQPFMNDEVRRATGTAG